MKSITDIIPEPKPERATETRNCADHGDFQSGNIIGRIWTKCPVCNAEAREAEERQQQEAMAKARRDALHAKIDRAGIPDRFMTRSLKNYVAETPAQKAALDFAINYADTFGDVMKTGRSAVFLGRPGTGKTHLACGIGLRVMQNNGANVLFITVMDAMMLIKDSWNKGTQMTEAQAISTLVAPDLLILDEVGVQLGSDFEKTTLFNILNKRYERMRPTIFLSNLTKDEITLYLGERIMDRIREDGGTTVPFTWESHRKQMGR